MLPADPGGALVFFFLLLRELVFSIEIFDATALKFLKTFSSKHWISMSHDQFSKRFQ